MMQQGQVTDSTLLNGKGITKQAGGLGTDFVSPSFLFPKLGSLGPLASARGYGLPGRAS
ncbi:MAG: hypothetical protein AAGF67_03340 [Verrucomicrobiota bacterium]